MLSRWDPFREMLSIRDPFDRFFEDFFEDFFTGTGNGKQSRLLSFPVDVVETNDQYIVRASIPGVNPDNLEITYLNNMLTIKGESKPEDDKEKPHYYLRERRFGRFQRSISLPLKVAEDRIEAKYEAGVLTLLLPKSEEVRPKHIPIQSGAQPKMIEGQFKETA
jgi:HSP20 family protein